MVIFVLDSYAALERGKIVDQIGLFLSLIYFKKVIKIFSHKAASLTIWQSLSRQ